MCHRRTSKKLKMEEQVLCAAGCGYYGHASTQGYCLVCYLTPRLAFEDFRVVLSNNSPTNTPSFRIIWPVLSSNSDPDLSMSQGQQTNGQVSGIPVGVGQEERMQIESANNGSDRNNEIDRRETETPNDKPDKNEPLPKRRKTD